MKAIFICNTPFQIITAINMAVSNLKNIECDIVISDEFFFAEILCKRVNSTKLFRNVYYAEEKKKFDNNFLNIMYSLFPKLIYKRYDFCKTYDYDYVFFNNVNFLSAVIFKKSLEANSNVKAHRFEEGYSSYFNSIRLRKSYKFFEKVERVYGKKALSEIIERHWYYEPELAEYNHDISVLKKICKLSRSNDKLVNILNVVFAQDTLTKYKQKYIFFEERTVAQQCSGKDIEILNFIATVVGKENILVRLHPRSFEDRFEKLGYITEKPNGTPWEITQLNNDFSQYIFLTFSSGSALASKMYYGDSIETVFLYKFIKGFWVEEFNIHLNRILEKEGKDHVYVPESIDELLSVLNKINKNN